MTPDSHGPLSQDEARKAWIFLVEHLFNQRNTELEAVRKAIREASTPLPEDVIEKLVILNPTDVHEVLREHPGFPLWDRHRSYETSFGVFNRCFADLIKTIEHFETQAADASIFERPRRLELADIQAALQKELFASANAAASLVDHSRRLQRLANVADYEEQLRGSFGHDGLHEFIIDLRVLLHHLYSAKPNYRWQKNFREGAKPDIHFELSRDHLVQAARDSDGKRLANFIDFLSQGPEYIDLKETVDEYRKRTIVFHAWFSGAVRNSNGYQAVRDYERCVVESRKFAQRTWWAAMLGNLLNWERPPNPYDHLATYLTPEQLEEVHKLPMYSKEQIDKAIELGDSEQICDENLREMIYQLFEKSRLASNKPEGVAPGDVDHL